MTKGIHIMIIKKWVPEINFVPLINNDIIDPSLFLFSCHQNF